MSIVLILGPGAEPVTLADALNQIGINGPADDLLDTALTQKVTGLIMAARQYCEDYTRRVFMTQTWKQLMDGWPRHDPRYDHGRHHRSIVLPKPQFQSVSSFTYVDTQGDTQDMFTYGFQVDPGSETQPARLMSPYEQPWPILRHVPNNVQVQFRCGYGGHVKVSTTAASTVLGVAVWNKGDVGLAITIPGAGGTGIDLVTSIASIDDEGFATLADNAVAAVDNVQAYAGQPVPQPILQAILFMVQFFFEQGATVDLPIPRVVAILLDPYRNLVA